MTVVDPQPGWIARTFTRARVMGGYLARIPFGDKTLDLPFVLHRVQLWVLAIGAVVAVVAYAVGSLFGIAGPVTWTVVVVTILAAAAVGRSDIPDQGAGVILEGYARGAAGTVRRRQVSSSRSRPARPRSREAMVMRLHPAPVASIQMGEEN